MPIGADDEIPNCVPARWPAIDGKQGTTPIPAGMNQPGARCAMVDERGKLLARFIMPLRVRPGSTVKLARDFAPDHRGRMIGGRWANRGARTWRPLSVRSSVRPAAVGTAARAAVKTIIGGGRSCGGFPARRTGPGRYLLRHRRSAVSRVGLTLRRRTGGKDAGWHLKLAAGNGIRDAVRVPLATLREDHRAGGDRATG